MTPKALLIDLDGVIRHWLQSDSPIEVAHGLPIGSIRKAAFSESHLTPAITGKISDEDWRSLIAKYLGSTYGVSSAIQAVAEWSAHSGSVDHTVLSLLSACTVVEHVILTTNATSRLGSDLQSMGIAGHFSAVINSSEVGAAKPDAHFFQAALSRAQVSAGQALFIDDTPTNVEAAQSLGIRAHRYVSHAELVSFLVKEGALSEPAP